MLLAAVSLAALGIVLQSLLNLNHAVICAIEKSRAENFMKQETIQSKLAKRW